MANIFLSILTGICFGFIYVHMFLGQLLHSSENTSGFSFSGMFNSFFRLILITVAIIMMVIYIKLNFILILLGFIGAFWGTVLIKIRTKR